MLKAMMIGVALGALSMPGVAQAHERCVSNWGGEHKANAVYGSGVEASELRRLERFSSIEAGGIFELEIVAGQPQRVEVSADDNLLSRIETRVVGDRLVLDLADRTQSCGPIRVRIAVEHLEGLDLSGAAEASASGISGRDFELEMSGASELDFDGAVGRLEADMSGAAELRARGSAAQLELENSGASKVTLLGFSSDEVELRASGAAHVDLGGLRPTRVEARVSGASDVNLGRPREAAMSASGVSSISYSGNPRITRRSTSGQASIGQR
ncbi:head GIN domain-containing protein [Sphingomicrobium arenosum]|uniref:head GIN domain-containing protein n=1 Tax=Sphingomicrobium arenosum TaxID=2233861 RepID=UPI00223F4981|nr:head GIN domain-containing protein [Sphingomicrobium arenosum]